MTLSDSDSQSLIAALTLTHHEGCSCNEPALGRNGQTGGGCSDQRKLRAQWRERLAANLSGTTSDALLRESGANGGVSGLTGQEDMLSQPCQGVELRPSVIAADTWTDTGETFLGAAALVGDTGRADVLMLPVTCTFPGCSDPLCDYQHAAPTAEVLTEPCFCGDPDCDAVCVCDKRSCPRTCQEAVEARAVQDKRRADIKACRDHAAALAPGEEGL